MASKNTISLTEARKKIFRLADAVQNPDTYYFLTENGKTKAVMMSAEEFEMWQETLEVITDADMMKDIQNGLTQLSKQGLKSFSPWEDVKKSLILHNETEKKLSRRTQQGRRKKS